MSRKTGRSRSRNPTLRDEKPPTNRAPGAAAPTRRRPAGEAATRREPLAWLQPRSLVKWIVWGGATFAFFYFTAVGIERMITWYLAVDQFGYLTFAHDLLHGRVFHEWGPMRALEPFFPARTDVLAQTYVYDEGRLYCRYSPGFPMLLAGWIGLLGDDRAHALNPTVYLVLLAVTLAFQWRVFHSPWRAAAGTALIALFPTMMHLWGLTLTRDLSAHLFAFTGLLLLVPARGKPLHRGRLLAAGLALGFTAAIRPDAVLYLVPAAGILAVRWWHERRRWEDRGLALASLALAAGVFVGSSPILAYNWAATGNPILPTQGMELPLLPTLPPPKWKQRITSQAAPAAPPAAADTESKVGYPSRGWRGGTYDAVQGGGLRISNLATTLPGNWQLVLRAYTPLLFGIAVWGAVVASVLRPTLAVAAVSYGVVAFLFFSCWPRPDSRYLIGVFVFIPMLIIEGTMGTLDLIRLLWKQHKPELARGLAVFAAGVFLLGALLLQPVAGSVSLPVFLVVTLIAGVAAALAATMPSRRVVALAAPALMLGLVWCKVSDVDAQEGRRAPFQHAQMLDARANMQKLLEPNAVVITTEEVGRPAENIEYYSGVADALYMTDLERWRVTPYHAALYLIIDGKRPYLFIPANQLGKDRLLADLREQLVVDLVADITPQRAMAHFVAAPFHRGVRMELYRLSFPKIEAGLPTLPRAQPPPAS